MGAGRGSMVDVRGIEHWLGVLLRDGASTAVCLQQPQTEGALAFSVHEYGFTPVALVDPDWRERLHEFLRSGCAVDGHCVEQQLDVGRIVIGTASLDPAVRVAPRTVPRNPATLRPEDGVAQDCAADWRCQVG